MEKDLLIGFIGVTGTIVGILGSYFVSIRLAKFNEKVASKRYQKEAKKRIVILLDVTLDSVRKIKDRWTHDLDGVYPLIFDSEWQKYIALIEGMSYEYRNHVIKWLYDLQRIEIRDRERKCSEYKIDEFEKLFSKERCNKTDEIIDSLLKELAEEENDLDTY